MKTSTKQNYTIETRDSMTLVNLGLEVGKSYDQSNPCRARMEGGCPGIEIRITKGPYHPERTNFESFKVYGEALDIEHKTKSFRIETTESTNPEKLAKAVEEVQASLSGEEK